MRTYLRPALLSLVWSLFVVLSYNHFVQYQNPFLGSVCSILLVMVVLIQIVLLRKRGGRYVGVFLLGLLVATAILLYADNRIFSPARRYYGTISQQ